MTREIAFTKGHGTQNDFVVVPDLDGHLDLSPADVAWLADRRAGVGGDGVIRVVRTALVPEVAEQAAQAEYLMDYRNADGSTAQMCGNGTRVFTAWLRRSGLLPDDVLAGDASYPIATRAGVKHVRVTADGYSTDLGPWRVVGGAQAVTEAADAVVSVAGLSESLGSGLPGLSVDLGNPHTVVALPTREALDSAQLHTAPVVTPDPPEGTNVELVVPLDVRSGVGHAVMRVHERGSGETRSCGTGAVATAVAVRVWGGPDSPLVWRVDVPGGTVRVDLTGAAPGVQGLAGGQHALLSGPAELVADGVVHLP